MKRRLTLAAAFAALTVLAPSAAIAASISISQLDPNATVYSLFLDGRAAGGGADLNGAFNAVSVAILASPSTQFTALTSGVGSVPGDPHTFRSPDLDAAPFAGGHGWSILGAVATA